ncbi:MAG: glycerol-3-phosphate dehydrogenase, partial [Halioglobus sp.]|nr:glycerol-3-phosphate dehydrogenase [Halioglobus sp.]
MTRKPLLVLGAGAWGTALALVAARTGPVQLWSWDEAQVEQMTRRQENHAYLPGIMFPDSLHPTADIGIAAQTRDVLIAVPCSALRETVSRVLAASRGQSRIAWACKGFDHATCQLPSDVVQELAGTGTPLACLSGPTFAREVAEDLPAAITIATNDDAFGGDLLRIFRAGRFRPYLSTDLVGVQV